MCHRRGMCDQTLDASQRLGERKALKCVDEPLYAIDSTVYFEAHHGAEGVLLRRGDAVPGMRAQSRIVHALHGLVVAQETNDACRVLAVNTHPSMKSSHTAQSEKAVEGGASDSETVRPPRQFFNQRCVRRHDRTADDVAVSVEVFRSRVYHQVRAEFDRPLERGREEGVIDRDEGSDVVPRFDYQSQICHPEKRIARCFDPQQLGPPRLYSLRRALTREIDEPDVKVPSRGK